MRKLHIIMPMAGEGSRFVEQGFTTPKPLIHFEEKALFLRAIRSVDDIRAKKKYSFILRQEHIDAFSIDKEILSCFPGARIFSVKKTTRGAIETCLMASEVIADEDGQLVLDCDLEFHSSSFNRLILEILQQPADTVNGGVLLSFDAHDPRYSYALTDGSNKVIRTAEKEVISNNALAGAYFFSTGKSFILGAKRLLSDSSNHKSELYVSLLYNYLIKAGETVVLVSMEKYRSFGTPEELRQNARQNN